jgi:hypothetical protein
MTIDQLSLEDAPHPDLIVLIEMPETCDEDRSSDLLAEHDPSQPLADGLASDTAPAPPVGESVAPRARPGDGSPSPGRRGTSKDS